MSTPTILQKIVATKHLEIAQAKANVSLDELKEKAKTSPAVRGFAKALRTFDGKIGVISEIKKASPSKGVICHNFDPITIAKAYEQAGATCLSVLTDREYFMGHDDYLIQAKNACALPVLRKDFMVDEYHIYESRALGADCILLIMACLDDETVATLHKTAIELGMDVLIEIHDESELHRALKLPKSAHNIYGINNRNLNTFEVDLNTTINLAKTLRDELGADALIVSESGIHGADDVHLMGRHDIHHFLIGEQFMKTDNVGQALAKLLSEV
ncbi:MAG: indole-3-glycerol phosphate synthase TrpC [Moraxella sp.]|uniref:indole-3-glycerol phosphate synthase TrpC n=1 Tax=Moraxella sp. TaxID=479 RepID=UPI0026DD9434|nr:indole-3-glycerol phosphate synthase TrpC [Moraxella sp.]MDO4451038.1 indole-3-glycerol phosphate synthase TrpC [Moraxella sp.]